ncbi:helix-turn-helix domain-containing protein [Phenylobacterium sp.]|uniref:helix-turn-helix domain-containing protein n=1 Tax=Phenylobacterium sp. TaxID=1871053 RepID=UPI0025E8098D|nr:excisionase family DNA-binding protein [Phenylobacterium sp.]MBX3485425.1 excisionase family DNA-binding protein [Phenylobacterium sp.]
MSQDVYTVEHAAERLKLHPKTILRAIRDERLRATRVGKSYRILRGDLEAFGGLAPRAPASAAGARTTAIVDVPDVSPERADRLMSMVPAVLNSRDPAGPPARADVVYDPGARTAKVVIVASPGDAGAILKIIQVWLES